MAAEPLAGPPFPGNRELREGTFAIASLRTRPWNVPRPPERKAGKEAIDILFKEHSCGKYTNFHKNNYTFL
jgi:hypothetical protein